MKRLALLIPLAALAGCAAGSTLRVADEDTAPTSEPVVLTPEPEADTRGAAPVAPPSDTAAARGYVSYGENSPTLEIRRIGQWTHTGIGEARRMVIRDVNAWAQLWSELGAGDRPDVDFTRNVVVVAAAGQRPSGGHEIAVSRVSQADGQLTIEVVETTPSPNCVTTMAVTQPVDAVVVPAVAPRGWSFLERREIRACR